MRRGIREPILIPRFHKFCESWDSYPKWELKPIKLNLNLKGGCSWYLLIKEAKCIISFLFHIILTC